MSNDRLLGYTHAFDHPGTIWISAIVASLLAVAPILIVVLTRTGVVEGALGRELRARYRTWLLLVPMIFVPILLGAAWTIMGVVLLGLACFREYSRATGLFREKLISLVVVIAIVLIGFATIDNWYGVFVALSPVSVGAIAVAGILKDSPSGYIQRVALGVLGFMLFGCALGHLAYIANDPNYRPVILMLLLLVEMNDVFAFSVGKCIGRRKLARNTSPNKTVEGAIGALLLTTGLAVIIGHVVFRGTVFDSFRYLAFLGVIVSITGQLGDLTVSSIKRDVGIKDMASSLPGHGGILDRFNSLLWVAPASFHYLGYFFSFGADQPTRIFSGG